MEIGMMDGGGGYVFPNHTPPALFPEVLETMEDFQIVSLGGFMCWLGGFLGGYNLKYTTKIWGDVMKPSTFSKSKQTHSPDEENFQNV